MDPDKLLAEALETAKALIEASDAGHELDASATYLADRLLSLDEWLCKGGFLPHRWQPRRN